MERFAKSLIYFVFSFLPSYGIGQTAGFTIPDTVCVSQAVNITNISPASSYYWNFCVADILNTPPVGVNLGNVGGVVSWPVFSDFVEYNGNFYVFVVNHFGASFGIARLDFGNSLLNTPTGIDFGNFNNILRRRLEGIQIVNEGGKWYAFVVGGDPDGGDVPQLARIDFGSDIANPNPIATDLGNIGGMYQPLDLYMFKENGVWHGFTVNKNGSLTRFEFANGLENAPATQNYPLGLNYPTGVNVINENGNFFVFVTVADDNSIARLDFGNSLLNTPVVNNLGNPNNALFAPRDITILRFCDVIVGFAVNSPDNSNLVRLDFHNDVKGVPDAISLGNMNGNLSFPHSLSRLFRVGDNVYSFITNVDNRTITRIQFPSCTNASLSSFNGQSPPPIKYNAPGVYNINLTIDDGLPTQSSFCRQVVVVRERVHTPLQTIVLSSGGSVKIGTSNPSSTYQWFPSGPNSDSITVTSEGLYIVETSGYGCSNRDSFRVVRQTDNSIHFTIPDTVCVGTPVTISDVPPSASSYYWNFCVADILNTPPVGVNMGNFGGALSYPVFSDVVESNGNYYVFVVNHFNPSGVVRLNFGNSLLNTPTVDNLGNFSNALRNRLQGIQVVFEGGNWYAFIVGGDPDFGDVPQFLRLDFGDNIENNAPVITDFGNIGNLYHPLDLFMFKENGQWHGFAVNKNGTVTRFSFLNGLSNTATAQNYPIGLAFPVGVNHIYKNGKYYVFVTERQGNSIKRLDFGESLLNNPTIVDLGNPGNLLEGPADLTILQFCDNIVGFTINGYWGNKANQLIRLDFNKDIESIPYGTTLGNIGSLSNPHSISKLFRVEDKVYSFITNVGNTPGVNTGLTRIEFPSCTNSSMPGSSNQIPPPITYDMPGVYNINLTIDDGLPTQASLCRQVVVVSQPVHTPIQTIILRPGESVKIGTANISGTYEWNTTNQNIDSITVDQEGLYFVETSGYGCSNVDSFRIVFTTADFSYEQDPCDPLRVTFKNESPGSIVIDWDLGNGQTAPGNSSPVVTYSSLGNYSVTLSITNSSGLNESVTKEVAVQVQNDNIIITKDTTICKDATIQLNAIDALSYCWTPSATLSAVDIANPVASPVTTTIYYLNSAVTGDNLIVNGNFSAGNTGFTSGYKYVSANTTEGEYYIGNNPQAWNSNFSSNCTDHSGAGNMMLVNGNPTPDINIWSQTISVTPNTNYAFSTWLQSLFPDNPAQLMFSINGIPIGNMITASLPVCNWTQFYTMWNSGNNTTAVISIINKNTIVWGNDFAIDDISFAPVFIKRDSVTITIEKPVITARTDTAICEGVTVQLNVTGTADSYQWSPATGLSETSVANPLATPVATTAYIVTGTTLNGCEAKDTVNIMVHLAPEVRSVDDTLLCGPGHVFLTTNGNAVSHLWSPADGLSDINIASPVASPSVTTQYIVTAMSGEGCTASDTVNITVSDAVVIHVNNDTLICEGSSVQLQATGNANFYSWTPSAGLSDLSIANPVANPLVATQYILEASTIEGCIGKDTVNIAVNPAPVISLTDNTIICPNTSIQLLAAGGLSYQWHTSSTLSAHDIPDPYASPSLSTTYIVDVTDGNNCTSTDSVTISVRDYPVFTASADTTICEGVTATLFASGGDQYQWTPATGLDNPVSASPIAGPATSTQYSVYISENTCGIDTTIRVWVNVNPAPRVAAQKSNDINCIERSSRLTATGALLYTWSPALHLDNAQRSNPVAILDTTTLFTVKGINAHGCSGTDTITVKVSAEGHPLFLLPNVFTPNNDRINDCFGLSKWGVIQLKEFSIYNRWGEKVFSTNDPNTCWNGTYKGIEQPSGTFVYVVRARTFCGTIDRKGTITLIR